MHRIRRFHNRGSMKRAFPKKKDKELYKKKLERKRNKKNELKRLRNKEKGRRKKKKQETNLDNPFLWNWSND